VERLSKLLDIDVSVESRLGQGSCFTLSIPAGVPEKIVASPPSAPVSISKELLVLVVENDKYIRYGMQVLLQSYGCETLCAADIATATELLNQNDCLPDIILADYHLDGNMTGTQAILELRDYLGEDIPALLVTGDASANSEQEAARYNLPLLYKPVESDKLLAAINSELSPVTG